MIDDTLKQKLFLFTVKLQSPKEEVMEVMPFVIAVAAYLCLHERISEKITMILEV